MKSFAGVSLIMVVYWEDAFWATEDFYCSITSIPRQVSGKAALYTALLIHPWYSLTEALMGL